jgi:hypothetical protein
VGRVGRGRWARWAGCGVEMVGRGGSGRGGPAGERYWWASPRAHQVALGEGTSLLRVWLSAKPLC